MNLSNYDKMNDVANLTLKLIRDMKREFPELRLLHKKNSLLHKAIDYLLKKITFGKYNDYMYMTTVIGYKIYLPLQHTPINYHNPTIYSTLRHERIHLKQYRKAGLTIWYAILYLLCLPFIFTMRAKYESEAYAQSLFAHIYTDRILGRETGKEAYRKTLWKLFSGITYFWMFPFKKKFNEWFEIIWLLSRRYDIQEDVDAVYKIKYISKNINTRRN